MFGSTYTAELNVSSKKVSRDNPQPYFFRYFAIGAMTFLVGLGTVVYVSILLPSSEKQEWLALIGLALGIPGGIVAFYCYIRMLIARFKHFFNS